jgi:hypothetical protein
LIAIDIKVPPGSATGIANINPVLSELPHLNNRASAVIVRGGYFGDLASVEAITIAR